MVGRMRGWRISPKHFVEHFGLIIIIALGESIVAIGVGAAGLPLDADMIAAALLGIIIVACIWWVYFDWVIFVAQAALAQATWVSPGARPVNNLQTVCGVSAIMADLPEPRFPVSTQAGPAQASRRDQGIEGKFTPQEGGA
jgi:hypothetical protein